MAVKKKKTTKRTTRRRAAPKFLSLAQFRKAAGEFKAEQRRTVRDISRARPDATAVTPRKGRAPKRAAKKAAADTGFDPRDATGDRLVTPVRSQGDSNRCIAFAVAGAMEAALCRAAGSAQDVPEINVEHVFSSNGGQVGSVQTVQGAVAMGVLDVACLTPGDTVPCADADAHTWRCDLRAVQALKKERVNVMKNELRNTGPLVSLIQVFKDFIDHDGAAPYEPSAASAGFHAVCIVGYEVDGDGTSGRWIAKNSMGSAWGDQGFVRIPWQQSKVKPEEVVYVAANVRRKG